MAVACRRPTPRKSRRSLSKGGAQKPQSGFLDGERAGGRGWDLAVVDVPVVLQRQVPAVQVVHVLDGAPDPVHRQSADLPVVQLRPQNRRRVPQVQFWDKVVV